MFWLICTIPSICRALSHSIRSVVLYSMLSQHSNLMVITIPCWYVSILWHYSPKFQTRKYLDSNSPKLLTDIFPDQYLNLSRSQRFILQIGKQLICKTYTSVCAFTNVLAHTKFHICTHRQLHRNTEQLHNLISQSKCNFCWNLSNSYITS